MHPALGAQARSASVLRALLRRQEMVGVDFASQGARPLVSGENHAANAAHDETRSLSSRASTRRLADSPTRRWICPSWRPQTPASRVIRPEREREGILCANSLLTVYGLVSPSRGGERRNAGLLPRAKPADATAMSTATSNGVLLKSSSIRLCTVVPFGEAMLK